MPGRLEEKEDGPSLNIEKLKKSKSNTPFLDHFGRDLTMYARDGKLDPVFERDDEINKIIRILNKRKKNNPVLVGEPGVGKTAVVEGLAIRIVSNEVDRWLKNKKIVEINLSSIVSGTKYRGEFEQRMEELVKEIEGSDNLIVFIDELHNAIGAGGASGSLDASNIIKPALSRGTMRCIGATTLDEYKKIIEGDGAFERRFQKVYIKVPSKEQTIIILENIKSKYENHHGVLYSSDIINSCVELSDRYINYRNFPDKAIDLIDEIGSKVKLQQGSILPDNIENLEREVFKVVEEKKQAAIDQDFEAAARFRDREREIYDELDKENKKWEELLKKNKIKIKLEDVASIVASHTGVPVEKLTESENTKLVNLEENLNNNVIGQEVAVKKIVQAIHRSRIGIQDPNQPIASLLFLGSTGVGKTYLAKVLAEHLFNSKESFIRFDMSEYMEKHSASKMIGAPPGYVGFEDRGQLTERIRNNPYSLILFDEIEKAHADVFNVLLQVLDDGKLTDSKGVEVNFKNTIIIMTSNIGTEKLLNENPLGFNVGQKQEDSEKIVFKELKKRFRPEMLNRIDEKIVFNMLSEEDIFKIIDIELQLLNERLGEKGYEIRIDDSLRKLLAEEGYDKKNGARPLKRAITKYIENTVSDSILRGIIKKNKKARLVYDTETEEVKVEG